MQDLELPPECLLLDLGKPWVIHIGHGLIPKDSDQHAVVLHHVQVIAVHCVVLVVLEALGNSCGLTLYQGVVLLGLVAEVSTNNYQLPTFRTACGHDLLTGASLLLQDPTHSLLAVVVTEAGDKLHVQGGNTIHDQLGDLVLAALERDLQVIIPLEGCGLDE